MLFSSGMVPYNFTSCEDKIDQHRLVSLKSVFAETGTYCPIHAQMISLLKQQRSFHCQSETLKTHGYKRINGWKLFGEPAISEDVAPFQIVRR